MTDVAQGLGWPHLEDDGAGVTQTAPLGWPRQGSDHDAGTQDKTIGQPPDVGDVSRETMEPPLPPVLTAAQIAARGLEDPMDADTPIAVEARAAILAQLRDPLPVPERTRVMVVANQKGGVGKTTTTVNVAAALALHGLRVLVVDLDPQGNASTALGVEHHSDVSSVYEVLIEETPVADVVQLAPSFDRLYCLPATIHLAGAEIELVSMVARESRLRRALHRYLDEVAADGQRFDYVLIDCPPSLGLLTVNALVGGDEVLIPIQCEYYALEGLTQLIRNVDLVKAHLNPGLEVTTIMLTMYDARTRLAAQVAEQVREHFGSTALDATIPRSVRISEAPSYGQTVLTYDPSSSGALSYQEAAREIARRAYAPAAVAVGAATHSTPTPWEAAQ